MPPVSMIYNEAYSTIRVSADGMSMLETSSFMEACLAGTLQTEDVPHEYETVDKIRNSVSPQTHTQAVWLEGHDNSSGEMSMVGSSSLTGLTDTLQIENVPHEYETVDKIRNSVSPQPHTQAAWPEGHDHTSSGIYEAISANHLDHNVPNETFSFMKGGLTDNLQTENVLDEYEAMDKSVSPQPHTQAVWPEGHENTSSEMSMVEISSSTGLTDTLQTEDAPCGYERMDKIRNSDSSQPHIQVVWPEGDHMSSGIYEAISADRLDHYGALQNNVPNGYERMDRISASICSAQETDVPDHDEVNCLTDDSNNTSDSQPCNCYL